MNKIKFFTLLIFCSILAIFLIASGTEYELTWDLNTSRDISYDVILERGLTDQGQPEEVELHTLKFQVLSNGDVDVKFNDVYWGTFETGTGEMEIANEANIPPYMSIILFSLLPVDGITAAVGGGWQTFFPGDTRIAAEDEKIALQDKYQVTFESVQDENLLNLQVEGYTKAIHNTRLTDLLGQDLGDLAAIVDWNFFLIGTSVYNVSETAIQEAELFYILMPATNNTVDSVINSIHRHHVLITRTQ